MPICCGRCKRNFATTSDFERHRHTSPKHRVCDKCNGMKFTSHEKLVEHGATFHSFHCVNCDRFFDKRERFNSHCATWHQPKSQMPFCCLGKPCSKRFASISALVQHMESGGCNSKLTRATMRKIVVRLDMNHVVTKPNRLFAAGYGGSEIIPLCAPTSSWNGSFYECLLCQAGFPTLASLNHHLQSPIHEEAMYVCPNRAGCKQEFTTLGGLFAHTEKNRCGVQNFQYAQEMVKSLVGLKTLEF